MGFDDEAVSASRLKIIEEQLFFLAKNKGRDIQSMNLIPCAGKANGVLLKMLAHKYGFNYLDRFNFGENLFEYPGLLDVKKLAELYSDSDLILYCHSKGTVNQYSRQLGNFKFNLEVLLKDSSFDFFLDDNLNKAGVFASEAGFIWYNFWIARCSFLKDIEVDKSSDRFYFEYVLSGDQESTKSLFRNIYPELNMVEKSFYTDRDLNKNDSLQKLYELFKVR